MPVPEGIISTSTGPVEPVGSASETEEEFIDTKGYSTDLILKVSELIMLGGHSNIQAVAIIDLVTNWDKDDLPELS